MEEATHDELAGVVDLFDALTRAELERALVELAYRRGADVREDAVSAAVAEAVREYYLVELPAEAVAGDVDVHESRSDPLASGNTERSGDADEALVVGPVAFPMLPAEGEDLPHILDVPERSVDHAAAAEHVAERLREESETVVDDDDAERAATLVDVTYDAEAWGPVELGETRDRLLALVD
ncbi:MULTISPECIES: DUF7109 family protein [Halolamina]|uniref:Uncharacterized protein n=1 Tax=Halolamina pelagica TaxID=699431 RepID=A0A1I5TZ56_9EURY|nr:MULTISPECIES: hypothetical protein [Halolamina]NHX36713.1 hypothetical protein [Halolamina sp. R1-12]SFP88323.1 hypothetical protein SAMN05216277_11128 [Halolamina pelagica]